MIAALKPYEEYKESGLPWVLHVPSTWKVVRNGSLFGQRNQTGHEALPILEVSLKTGVRVRNFENSTRKQVMSDFGKYKHAARGDVAYNTMRMWQGAVGVSPVDGLVSPAYVVARPYPDVEPRFFVALFRTDDYMSEIDNCSRGIVKDRNRLYWDQFKQILSPCPPPAEQAAIVRFLDWANGRLERAIRAKRKVIALLGEQKQAIIHRAVTRGLDPSVRLKPSGIPWLGDIPQHWGTVRNLALFSHRVEEGIPGLPVLQVSLHSGISAEALDQFGRPKRLIADHTKYKLIRKDDLAYNTMRMWQGAVGVSSTDGLVSPAYVVIRPRTGVHPRFYEFVFRTGVYKQQVNRHSTGIVSDRNRLYWESFKQMHNVLLPVEEQLAICRFIQQETGSLNFAISRLEREIELLREYRTRLVADVVTGKLDVREAAARLPDEAAPDTVEEPADVSDETEPFADETAA